MLYNMLCNPFRTRARVADPPAYPFAAGALVYAQLDSFVTRQGNGFAFLIRNPHSFPPNPPTPPRPPPHPRSRSGAAALSRSGAAAWRAAPAPALSWRAAPAPAPPLGVRHRSSCLLSSFKALLKCSSSVPGARRLEVGNSNHQCLQVGYKGLGDVRDLGKRRT